MLFCCIAITTEAVYLFEPTPSRQRAAPISNSGFSELELLLDAQPHLRRRDCGVNTRKQKFDQYTYDRFPPSTVTSHLQPLSAWESPWRPMQQCRGVSGSSLHCSSFKDPAQSPLQRETCNRPARFLHTAVMTFSIWITDMRWPHVGLPATSKQKVWLVGSKRSFCEVLIFSWRCTSLYEDS